MGSREPAEATATADSSDAGSEYEGLAAGPSGSSPTAPTAPSSGPEADITTLGAAAAELEFYLAVEVHYHRARQAWLAGAHRWMMFFAILLGSAAAASIFPPVAGLLVAAIGAADLCFDFTSRATQHSDLARRYLALAGDLAAAKGDAGKREAVLAGWIATSCDAPPVYHVALDLAHNRAIQSLGRDAAFRAPLPHWKRVLAHTWRFDGDA